MHPVNEIVLKFKNGQISHTECFESLSKSFRPLFENKKRSLAKVSTDHMTCGSFWNVYQQALTESLEKFEFRHENSSFIPFFQELFGMRTIGYVQILQTEIARSKNVLSLDEIVENQVEPKNLIMHDTVHDQMDLENDLKKGLTKKEYKIFYMKLKGRPNGYIASKMKKATSREMIRRLWVTISQKVLNICQRRQNESGTN